MSLLSSSVNSSTFRASCRHTVHSIVNKASHSRVQKIKAPSKALRLSFKEEDLMTKNESNFFLTPTIMEIKGACLVECKFAILGE
jgi:hypothetical protein